MQCDISLTPAQAHTLSTWAYQGDDAASVLIADSGDGNGVLRVAQGDKRATIDVGGTITDD